MSIGVPSGARSRASARAAFPVPEKAQLALERVVLVGERVLVAERRLEVRLVLFAVGKSIAHRGQIVRRIQLPIPDSVRVRLISGAEYNLAGDLVILSGLVRGAPGQCVHQRHLQASARLLQISERIEVQVLAVNGISARTPVAHEAVASVQRQRSALDAGIATDVNVTGGSCGKRESAARTDIGFLFEDDVDDPRHAFRIIAGRRVGYDLNLVDHVGGELREKIAELRRLQRTGTAVDLHDHTGVAAQADNVIDVDIDRGDIAQHVECGAAFVGRHIADHVGVPVWSEAHFLPLPGYHLRLQRDRHCFESHSSNVNALR